MKRVGKKLLAQVLRDSTFDPEQGHLAAIVEGRDPEYLVMRVEEMLRTGSPCLRDAMSILAYAEALERLTKNAIEAGECCCIVGIDVRCKEHGLS